LFTDIEGSTALLRRLGSDSYAELLADHHQIIRASLEAHGGEEQGTEGDSFFATFSSPSACVAATIEMQRALADHRWPGGELLRVRMGVHTGEASSASIGLVGFQIHRAARIAAVSNGGQVVLSASTTEMVRDSMPEGSTVRDLGLHWLKDLGRSEELYQLVVDGLSNDFPPLRTKRGKNPTNLTESASSFVGREAEIDEVVNLLGRHRMVTLAGPGGAGKTRLATKVGMTVLRDTQDGVWMAELSSVTDTESVAAEVVSQLGIATQPGKGALESLVEVLASQERLVILDNCEHVLDGSAATADAILRNCPSIRLIATSREPLRIDGEIVFRVPSLSLPPNGVTSRRDVAGSGAVALFAERASAQLPGFELTDENAVLVAGICRRLDGMPLALELAAARLSAMSVQQLHDRLEHRFDVLTRGSRLALPRHQTLRALVDWSYKLMDDAERSVFRRSSVFVGDFDLEAAEAVCSLSDNDRPSIGDHVASLVDKSLVVAEPIHGDVRYRLQETLREYGLERLLDSAHEAERAADAHADHFLGLAELAGSHLEGPNFLEWLERLEVEDQNLRSAIRHATSMGTGAERVVRQFWQAHRYWMDVRRPDEINTLLDSALDHVRPNLSENEIARALYVKSLLLAEVEIGSAIAPATEALELARQSGDLALQADVLSLLSSFLSDMGRIEDGASAGARALALAREAGDQLVLARVLYRYGAGVRDQRGEIESLLCEGLEIVEQTGDGFTEARLHDNYAYLDLELDRPPSEARRHLELSLQIAGFEVTPRKAITHGLFAFALIREGHSAAADELLLELVGMSRLYGLRRMAGWLMLLLAHCRTSLGELERPVVLYGAAEALRSKWGGVWEEVDERLRTDDHAVLRSRLGVEEFERFYAQGISMSEEAIFRFALQTPREVSIGGEQTRPTADTSESR
jgi:predicted ATPase/class 3 adenylate cyclase